MMNKTMIALSTVVILSSASAAFAYEDPENRIGDRYPSLEPTVAARVVNTSQNRMVAWQTTNVIQIAYEDPENRIGDRYPGLDQTTRSPTGMTASRYLAARYASNVNQDSVRAEEPENKVADRYPLLEQRTASRQFAGRVSSRSPQTTGSIR